jgi:hypothetical protein
VRVCKFRINRVILSTVGLASAIIGAEFGAPRGAPQPDVTYVFTETPTYDPKAWLDGRDRFSKGATLKFVKGELHRALVPEFYASADAAVWYDGSRVLFSGKRTPVDHWQIWEVDLNGGPPRQMTRCDSDCIRPLYLPAREIVYTRSTGNGAVIEAAGKRLTFAPEKYLTDEVLRDGRILFESTRGSGTRELFTIYPDGTGMESVRCDHGPDRGEAHQMASGDLVFNSGTGLARFTSALAAQTDVSQPRSEVVGPIAEITPGVWLVSMRRNGGHAGLYLWKTNGRQMTPLETPSNAFAVQPVIVTRRTPPREFPSALVPTRTAGNLLCLDARISRTPMDGAAVQAVRVYTQDAARQPALLGQADVEHDGSFYVQVPADRPLRIELVSAAGQVVRGERGWFWMRPSEQRICVGCHTGPERAPENKVPEILVRTITPVKMLEARQP